MTSEIPSPLSQPNDDEPPHASPEDNDTDDKSDTMTIVAPSQVIHETAMPERREESLHDQDSMDIDKITVAATEDQDHVNDEMDPNDESDFRDIVKVADKSNDDKKTKNAGGEQEITAEIEKDDSQESMDVVETVVAKNDTVDWDKQKKLGEALDVALDRLQEVNYVFNVILLGDTFLRELFLMHCVQI